MQNISARVLLPQQSQRGRRQDVLSNARRRLLVGSLGPWAQGDDKRHWRQITSDICTLVDSQGMILRHIARRGPYLGPGRSDTHPDRA